MDMQKAIEAITITAAKNCNIADRVGSIEAGKDADFVITSAPLLEMQTKILKTVILGDVVHSIEE